jgi:hypothetical protein
MSFQIYYTGMSGILSKSLFSIFGRLSNVTSNSFLFCFKVKEQTSVSRPANSCKNRKIILVLTVTDN